MTDEEWANLTALLENCWGGDWNGQRDEAYRIVLGEFSAADLGSAIGTFLERGEKWRPAASELLAECRFIVRRRAFRQRTERALAAAHAGQLGPGCECGVEPHRYWCGEAAPESHELGSGVDLAG